jgi:hypothetical protein
VKNIPNDPKIYQIATKCKYQMTVKWTKSFHWKTLQNLPQLDFFWFENTTIWQPWFRRQSFKKVFRGDKEWNDPWQKNSITNLKLRQSHPGWPDEFAKKSAIL